VTFVAAKELELASKLVKGLADEFLPEISGYLLGTKFRS
jgi:hypothetical protein